MITLSNINISHVLYPRIDLAGIRLGVPGGKGGGSPTPGEDEYILPNGILLENGTALLAEDLKAIVLES